MNNISVTGCLVSAPDINNKRANFTLVDNTFYNHPQFVNCVTFDSKIIERISSWGKGFLVEIAGRLEIKKFQKTKYTSIIIDRVNLLRKSGFQEYKDGFQSPGYPDAPDSNLTGGVLPAPPEISPYSEAGDDLSFEDVPF